MFPSSINLQDKHWIFNTKRNYELRQITFCFRPGSVITRLSFDFYYAQDIVEQTKLTWGLARVSTRIVSSKLRKQYIDYNISEIQTLKFTLSDYSVTNPDLQEITIWSNNLSIVNLQRHITFENVSYCTLFFLTAEKTAFRLLKKSLWEIKTTFLM